ncbi:MAG TPA: 5-oxoprolinase subunit PxpA [Opitutaceae bacterium]|nr:5-oxoprolinase subunit PxpA [Opitutaceae bacterium]
MNGAERRVDLNADVGEGAGADAAIFPCISSANIACGGHAGDERTMREAVRLALRHGVAVGAHPGYADRAGFGRVERSLSPAEVSRLVREQVGAIQRVAAEAGARVRHVKPHGALYNQAARDYALARAIADAVAESGAALVLFGLAGSELLRAGVDAGLKVASEVFADRRYQADGSLVPRSRGAEALAGSEDEAVAQALMMVREGAVRALTGERIAVRADTICLHGDSPQAANLAARLRREMEDAGVRVSASFD